MKISTKGRYALRLMLDLATEGNGKPVSIKDIAGRQGISEKYLEQIISSLNRAGYVKSVRGSQGGYLLKMDPKEYTVGMILRVTEGSLAPVDWRTEAVTGCPPAPRPCSGKRSATPSTTLWITRPWPIFWNGSRTKKITVCRSNLIKAAGYRKNLYLAVFFYYWTGFGKHDMISA